MKAEYFKYLFYSIYPDETLEKVLETKKGYLCYSKSRDNTTVFHDPVLISLKNKSYCCIPTNSELYVELTEGAKTIYEKGARSDDVPK